MGKNGGQSGLTTLLIGKTLGRVEQMRINSQRRFTNRSQGEHLSGKGGTSIEFSDYRDYVPGDDLRFVDWNIFSRLHRPYVKLYHQEEEMHVTIIVDGSSSMLSEGKFECAQKLAAAFGVMGLFASERVSVYSFNGHDERPSMVQRCMGRGNMGKVFNYLENVKTGGDSMIDEGVGSILNLHRGRGIVVICSDFLTPGDLSGMFNRLFSSGLEIFALQILGPTEIDPEVAGDLRLVDCETQETLDVSSAGNLLEIYQEYRQAYQRNLEILCRQRSGQFASVNSGDSIEYILFDFLRRKGWVR